VDRYKRSGTNLDDDDDDEEEEEEEEEEEGSSGPSISRSDNHHAKVDALIIENDRIVLTEIALILDIKYGKTFVVIQRS
jgi:hypothetical protein